MPARIDLTGQRFGRLTVLKRIQLQKSTRWLCQCDCGDTLDVAHGNLRSGCSQSCGCLRSDLSRARLYSHGYRRKPEYAIWIAMRDRCKNKKNAAYAYYGGRGIRVCESWDNGFSAFISDMGPRPSPKHLIERVNNDGNYEPSNCVWATRSQQMKNRRPWGSVNGRRQ
jgi:hypothetical protein